MNSEETTRSAQSDPPTLGEYNGFEVYPMPFFATLSAADPEALSGWYERALGFGRMFAGPVVHLRRRKYQDLLVVTSASGDAGAGGPTLTFAADGEIAALAARLAQEPPMGLAAAVGPVETPWNTRELRVTDPAGHRLVFTEPRADPELTARWKEAFEAGRRP